jgi:hypothetical protein
MNSEVEGKIVIAGVQIGGIRMNKKVAEGPSDLMTP